MRPLPAGRTGSPVAGSIGAGATACASSPGAGGTRTPGALALLGGMAGPAPVGSAGKAPFGRGLGRQCYRGDRCRRWCRLRRRRRRNAPLIGFQRAAAVVVAARPFRIGIAQTLELIGVEFHFADGEFALQRLGGDARFKRPGVGQRAGIDDADGRQRAAARLVGLRNVRRLRFGEPSAVDDQRGRDRSSSRPWSRRRRNRA